MCSLEILQCCCVPVFRSKLPDSSSIFRDEDCCVYVPPVLAAALRASLTASFTFLVTLAGRPVCSVVGRVLISLRKHKSLTPNTHVYIFSLRTTLYMYMYMTIIVSCLNRSTWSTCSALYQMFSFAQLFYCISVIVITAKTRNSQFDSCNHTVHVALHLLWEQFSPSLCPLG